MTEKKLDADLNLMKAVEQLEEEIHPFIDAQLEQLGYEQELGSAETEVSPVENNLDVKLNLSQEVDNSASEAVSSSGSDQATPAKPDTST